MSGMQSIGTLHAWRNESQDVWCRWYCLVAPAVPLKSPQGHELVDVAPGEMQHLMY